MNGCSTRQTTRRPRPNKVAALVTSLFVVGILVSACGGSDDASPSTTTPKRGPAVTGVAGDLTVSAAASLKDAFTRIGDDFEAANPGSEVTFNFGSSGALATQIQAGAPADVAAFAAASNMATLADAGLLDGPSEVFATNRLAIVTKPGNPKGIDNLAGLAGAGTVSLCADTAPCGKYANQVLADAGVTIPPEQITRGQDVRATLEAVTHGDAVGGIVYVTDAASAGADATTVAIPTDQNAVATYPIGVVKATTVPAAAKAFVAFVLSPPAQEVLKAGGFGPP